MLTSSTQLQNRSSHVEDWTRTTTKWTKMKIARGAKHAKAAVFFIFRYANFWRFHYRRRRELGAYARTTAIREFKKWRRQRQRQRHKLRLWLVERGKIIVLHVRHAYWWKFSTYSVKRRSTWNFNFWGSVDIAYQQQYIFHSLPLHENHSWQTSEKCTLPILYNVTNI